jgi:Ca-activated chloride channel family protein
VAFLGRVTGDPALVFWTEAGNYAEGFRRAEKIIHRSPSMVEASASAPLARGLLRVGAWTALLAVGLAVALVGGQRRRLRRRSWGPKRWSVAILGSSVAGLTAGVAGQLLYSLLSERFGTQRLPGAGVLAVPAAGRLLAWSFLGAVLGRGMARFIPNLPAGRSLLAGAAGGLAGGWGFAAATAVLGDRAGRLLGAPVLGLSLGLMIALVEAVSRRAWLEIDYGNDETESVALGAEPVVIGSDSGSCTVYASGAAHRACRYRMMGDRVVVEDLATHRTRLVSSGERTDIGDVAVTVRGADRPVRA